MSAAATPDATSEALKELDEAIGRLVEASAILWLCGKHATMDQMREELRSRIGTVEIAVELVRDAHNR